MRKSFDIGLVIPLKEEFEYVTTIAPIRETIPYDGTFLYCLDFGGPSVIACIVGEMGPLPASQSTTRLLTFANVRILILLGLAGSLDKDVSLGDVAVGKEVNEYLAESKAVPSETGFKLNYSGRHWSLDYIIRESISHFDLPGNVSLSDWHAPLKSDYNSLPEETRNELSNWPPKLHLGHIASGDIVGAATAFVDELKSIDRKFVAIDMEAAGAAKSAHDRLNPVRVLVIRGISDLADERKKSLDSQYKRAWRRYSVLSATSFMRALVCWHGFRPCITSTGSSDMPEATPDFGDVARRLVHATGGLWLLGILLGIYSHAPSITEDGEVVPEELDRLRVREPALAQFFARLMAIHPKLTAPEGDAAEVSKLIERLAGELASFWSGEAEAMAMIKDFDNVVRSLIVPDAESNDDLANDLLRVDVLIDEQHYNQAIELLEHLDIRDSRARSRLADTLNHINDYERIIDILERFEHGTLEQSEQEHLIYSFCKRGALARASVALSNHQSRFDTLAAKLFRNQLLAQYPALATETSTPSEP